MNILFYNLLMNNIVKYINKSPIRFNSHKGILLLLTIIINNWLPVLIQNLKSQSFNHYYIKKKILQ